MNIVFMGTPDFSVPILNALAKNYNVVAVVTQPDKPKGRKKRLTPSPVKEAANALGIEVLQPRKIKEHEAMILKKKPDVIVTAAYGQIIGEMLLNTPEYGAINVHASLLPKLRGGAPIQRAIERGNQETGVTVIVMGKGMDTGPMLSKKSIIIEDRETSGSLFDKLSKVGRDLLLDTLPKYIEGSITPTPQNHEEATYAYAIKREEEALEFNKSAIKIERKIRAFYPKPNTYVDTQMGRLKVLEGFVRTCDASYETGVVVGFDKNGLEIATKKDSIVLKTVQPSGKNPMDAFAFMNGAGRKWFSKGQKLS
jgi:methionyl-tRNA formyltransferase